MNFDKLGEKVDTENINTPIVQICNERISKINVSRE